MRIIGIQHRVKLSAEGEARPTRVAVLHTQDGGTGQVLAMKELATEQDEADFVMNDLHHGDTIALVLGGSGDYLAYALYRRAQAVGAQVMRIPAFALKQARDSESVQDMLDGLYGTLRKKSASDKTRDDHVLLALLAREVSEKFYPLAETDAGLILARECWRALWESMQARMAGEQRLRQLFIGRVFTRSDGLFPEGGIEQGFDAAKASDPIVAALRSEEKRRERELVNALEELQVYRELFVPIPGVGPKIAGRIISAIVDIRRFQGSADAELLAESYVRSEEHKRLGRVSEDWDIVGGRTYANVYSRIRAIADFKKAAGKLEEAEHVYAHLREMDIRKGIRNAGPSGASRLKAYMGVHVLPDGRFPRQRRGAVANWHGDARQALYLLGEQFNRRPDSEWGRRLRKNKELLRKKHPEVVEVDGKKRYTDGHIHKMALWRTLSQFVEWLYREWSRLTSPPQAAVQLPKAA